MTKAALCTHCYDIVAPHREWKTNRSWRWCECEHMGVRWRDGDQGLIEVTAMHGKEHVRILGLNNHFLIRAVDRPPADGTAWRQAHEASCNAAAGTGYLFGSDRRGCWALVVRVGESGDVSFVNYSEAVQSKPADPEVAREPIDV